MDFTQGADLKKYPDKETLVYLADTFGESGTMISLANMVILGGRLHQLEVIIL